jgi:hypothetical protein
MDFKKLVDQAKNKTKELSDKAVTFSSNKLASSGLTLKKAEDIQKIIDSSVNKEFTSKETGISKTFIKKSIIIFADEKSDFFKEVLYILPVLATKSFSQNIPFKIASSNIKDFDYKGHELKEFPSLVLYENKKIKKTLTGKENILKLVKTIDLDINKLIEEL